MRFKYKEQIGFCFFMKKISGNLCRSVAKQLNSATDGTGVQIKETNNPMFHEVPD